MAAAPNPKVAPQPVEVLNLEKGSGSRQRGFIVVQEGSRDKKPFRLGRVTGKVHP